MTGKNIYLSICIPTYNRGMCLVDCINTIIDQNGFDSMVEIVISDNASTDRTDTTIERYTKKYNNIHYYKNKSNIGFDKNLDNAVIKAHGKYGLILSDDDGLFPGALQEIIYILQSHKNNYYLSNSLSFDNKFQHQITNIPNLPFENIVYEYESLKDFIKRQQPLRSLGYFGAMSGQIFLREKWVDCYERKNYFGSQIIHLHTLLHTMKYEKFGIIGKPIIKARADNLRWDSFGMHNDIARIMMTLRSVKWIINNFDIKYNKFLFYIHFVTISGINVTIRLIKKYIFQNSKNLYNIRNYIFNKLK